MVEKKELVKAFSFSTKLNEQNLKWLIDYLKKRLGKLGVSPIPTLSDSSSIDSHLAELAMSGLTPNTSEIEIRDAELIKSIIKDAKNQLTSRKRKQDSNVITKTVELTRAGEIALNTLVKRTGATQNLIIESLLLDEHSYLTDIDQYAVKLRAKLTSLREIKKKLEGEIRSLRGNIENLSINAGKEAKSEQISEKNEATVRISDFTQSFKSLDGELPQPQNSKKRLLAILSRNERGIDQSKKQRLTRIKSINTKIDKGN